MQIGIDNNHDIERQQNLSSRVLRNDEAVTTPSSVDADKPLKIAAELAAAVDRPASHFSRTLLTLNSSNTPMTTMRWRRREIVSTFYATNIVCLSNLTNNDMNALMFGF